MTYRLTSAQRCVLADCVRGALTGWLLTDPVVGQMTRRMEYKATTVMGFSFSRFVSAAIDQLGASYHPQSPGFAADFPLGIAEAVVLANNIELEMATESELSAAGIIAAHSPLGQPEVCGRDWRTYTSMLTALGLSINDDCPHWRDEVRDRLLTFRRAVAAAAVSIPVAAE
jgi:hypothetical protein